MHVNQRRKANHIGEVTMVEGVQCNQPYSIGQAFLEYYQSLFSSSRPTGGDACLAMLEEKITTEMNEQLAMLSSREEVCIAISQMSPYKSPGPDGFPPCFY
jgi:hypothetical protein